MQGVSTRRTSVLSLKKECTNQQLLSLVGNLSFACPAVPIFLHCLIDLRMTAKHLHHCIQIFREAQLDIIWWQDFLPTWSGSSLIQDIHWTSSLQMH